MRLSSPSTPFWLGQIFLSITLNHFIVHLQIAGLTLGDLVIRLRNQSMNRDMYSERESIIYIYVDRFMYFSIILYSVFVFLTNHNSCTSLVIAIVYHLSSITGDPFQNNLSWLICYVLELHGAIFVKCMSKVYAQNLGRKLTY